MYARMSAFVLVLTLAVSGSVSAQETTGTVAGRIVDSQGLAVPGVAVTLTGSQGVKTVVTDADGRFAIPFLTPGAYTIRAELQGFKTAETKDLVVSIGQSTSADLTLEVGGLTDTVQVVATTVPIDVTSTTVGLVIEHRLAADSSSRANVRSGSVPHTRREQLRHCGSSQSVDFRWHWTGEPIHRRWRQRDQCRLWRTWIRTRERSARWVTRHPGTSSRKFRSRPVATTPSSARQPAVWSTW